MDNVMRFLNGAKAFYLGLRGCVKFCFDLISITFNAFILFVIFNNIEFLPKLEQMLGFAGKMFKFDAALVYQLVLIVGGFVAIRCLFVFVYKIVKNVVKLRNLVISFKHKQLAKKRETMLDEIKNLQSLTSEEAIATAE